MNSISPSIILIILLVYFGVLILVSQLTGKKADNQQFFIAGKKSPWLLVAIGMIGASLSGVTFISIPGVVGANGVNQAFSYMQMVFGYLLGYLVIAHVLMPVYYRMNLTSIYGYLEKRFGTFSYKTGAFYFLLSRVIGASFRLYLVAIVLQMFLMEPAGIPFPVTVAATIILIWIYTFRGGIKTIVWTDTLQTISMLGAVILTILYIGKSMDTGFFGALEMVRESNFSKVFFFEGGWKDPNFFPKQFLSGALIAIVMTGLDQDMMQKNLSCKTLPEAQKNIYTFSAILVIANVLFLSLGALLYIYAGHIGLQIPERTDQLYPLIAMNHLPTIIGIAFLIGLIAAAYSSADSALTALTTSFCIDFLNFEKSSKSDHVKKTQRIMVHVGFSIVLLIVILIFDAINNEAVINGLFKAAGYTYGPILGLFTYGMLSRKQIRDRWVIAVAVLAPLLSFILDINSRSWFNGFTFGFFILAVNGLLTITGLMIITKFSSDNLMEQQPGIK
jgi:Na+/proline symporter